jgi:hypothetical protein
MVELQTEQNFSGLKEGNQKFPARASGEKIKGLLTERKSHVDGYRHSVNS